MFSNKEDIFTAVFRHWLISRHPLAKAAVTGAGTKQERLFEVCRIMLIEPWADMIGAPMAGEFYEVCERLDPEIDALHRKVAFECISAIVADRTATDVFMLSLDGQIGDDPSVPVLEKRVRLLIDRFI